MILIDASNIHNGGGKVLLEYLLDELILKKIDFFLIKDPRWEGYHLPESQYVSIKSSFERKKLLVGYAKKLSPSSIFCFGNFPPPIKLPYKTVTYFQNPNLLDSIILQTLKDNFFIIKKFYINLFLKNTDFILFQNRNILDLFLLKFGKFALRNLIYLEIPFYNKKLIEEISKKNLNKSKKLNSFIYVSLPHNHKNHGKLLGAWELLAERNLYPELTLTIPKESINLINWIEKINSKGGNIINLGIVSFKVALEYTSLSEYCIFPSLKETFGLGLIEGALLNCKVIASDLKYVFEILEPSLVFNPFKAESIASAVIKCISEGSSINYSIPKIQNNIDVLINLLT